MTSNTVIFDGYLAELIRLQAEKCGLTPEVYIISFLQTGAMHLPQLKASSPAINFYPKGALHPAASAAVGTAVRGKVRRFE